MRMPHRGGFVHHAQHREASCFEETPNQNGREYEKDDIEPGRVVPYEGGLSHASVTLSRDLPQGAEYQFDNKRGTRHRCVERDEQEAGHLQPVILAIDVQDRETDQIGEDERDHATETDATA